MNAEQLMREVINKRKSEETIKLQKYNESSKRQLLKILETKLRTAFIAPLAYFEQAMGHLWGHGKKESELTETELHYRALWNALRTNVLNNGNNKIRDVHNELMQYTVTWNRYSLGLKLDNKE